MYFEICVIKLTTIYFLGKIFLKPKIISTKTSKNNSLLTFTKQFKLCHLVLILNTNLFFISHLHCINISGSSCSGETRCYTRLEPSLSGSAMCGAGSSCVKISQPPPMFDLYGYFVPPERRGPPITLYRGCFVLDMLKVG